MHAQLMPQLLQLHLVNMPHSACGQQEQLAGVTPMTENEMHRAFGTEVASAQEMVDINQRLERAALEDPLEVLALEVDDRIPPFHEGFAESGR
jgi:hypothetical protein